MTTRLLYHKKLQNWKETTTIMVDFVGHTNNEESTLNTFG